MSWVESWVGVSVRRQQRKIRKIGPRPNCCDSCQWLSGRGGRRWVLVTCERSPVDVVGNATCPLSSKCLQCVTDPCGTVADNVIKRVIWRCHEVVSSLSLVDVLVQLSARDAWKLTRQREWSASWPRPVKVTSPSDLIIIIIIIIITRNMGQSPT